MRPFAAFQLCLVALLLVLVGCASHQRERTDLRFKWQSKHLSSHPLVGKIWDVEAGRFIWESELKAQLVGAQYLLFGEIHDNPDHHQMQAELLEFLAAVENSPTVVMEQIDFEQAEALSKFMSKEPKKAENLGPAIGWEKTGWPPWELYLPIGRVIVEEGLVVMPGNYSKAQVRTIQQGRFRSLPGALQKVGRQLKRKVPKALEEAMIDDLVAGHCGLLSREAVRPMLKVQWARDRLMANQLTKAKMPAVLIAGNGHIQDRYGVAYHLKKRNPGLKVKSVAITEVQADKWKPELYEEGYDFVWFTPVYNPQDRCEALKAHFSSKKENGQDRSDKSSKLK